MLITYFIFLLIAIVFKVMHYPGEILIMLISPLFPFIDIIIQLVRDKENKMTRILTSISIFSLSIFLLFKFLNWPGSSLIFWIAALVTCVTLFRFFRWKIKYNLRFYIMSIVFLFSIFNFSIRGSDFELTYLLGDPFDNSEPIPPYYIQSLAYEFYLEGEYEKAEKLTQRNIDFLNDILEQPAVYSYMPKITQENLDISKNDLDNIHNHTWNYFMPLFRID